MKKNDKNKKNKKVENVEPEVEKEKIEPEVEKEKIEPEVEKEKDVEPEVEKEKDVEPEVEGLKTYTTGVLKDCTSLYIRKETSKNSEPVGVILKTDEIIIDLEKSTRQFYREIGRAHV